MGPSCPLVGLKNCRIAPVESAYNPVVRKPQSKYHPAIDTCVATLSGLRHPHPKARHRTATQHRRHRRRSNPVAVECDPVTSIGAPTCSPSLICIAAVSFPLTLIQPGV